MKEAVHAREEAQERERVFGPIDDAALFPQIAERALCADLIESARTLLERSLSSDIDPLNRRFETELIAVTGHAKKSVDIRIQARESETTGMRNVAHLRDDGEGTTEYSMETGPWTDRLIEIAQRRTSPWRRPEQN